MKTQTKLTSILCFVLTVSIHSQMFSQQAPPRAIGVFMFGFAKSVQWPDDRSQGDFVIGVVDHPELARELSQIAATRTLGARQIKVLEVSSAGTIPYTQMLFVSKPAYASLATLLSQHKGDPVLVLSQGVQDKREPLGINFLDFEGKLRFELNTSGVEARGIKVPGNLRSLGTEVSY